MKKYIVLFMLIIITLLSGCEKQEVFIDHINITTSDHLEIKDINNQKHLVKLLNDNNYEVVKYYNDTDKEIEIDKNIVFLEELENYYIAIYSSRENNFYKHNRYIIPDYEYNKSYDHIYIISKSTQETYILTTSLFYLIGNSIDLNSFQELNNTIYFTTIIPYENKLHSVHQIIINENFNNIHIAGFRTHHGFAIYPWEKSRYYISKYIIDDFNNVLYFKEDGEITISHLNYSYSKDGVIQTREYDDKLNLDFQTYLKEGYYTKGDDEFIYFVNNNLQIVKVSKDIDTLIYVKDVEDIENWIEEIK